MTTETQAWVPARSVGIAGHRYPLLLPTLRDPRLHLAAVIVSLQVLGQAVLGFELSIAQILVSILTCAVLEVALTFWRRRVLMWPASALLTGNGVALILRVPGTAHADWWSLRGAGIFAAAAAISLLSKYVIRVGGRHVFNPSNFGLVVVSGLLGTRLVNPQDLWWGPMSPGLVLTLAVIVTGGLVIVSRLRMLGLVPAFWPALAAAVVMGGVLLFVAGVRARPTDAVSGPVAGERFVGPAAAAIPSVAIDPAVHRIAASITPPSAQAMGQDMVAELGAKGGAS